MEDVSVGEHNFSIGFEQKVLGWIRAFRFLSFFSKSERYRALNSISLLHCIEIVLKPQRPTQSSEASASICPAMLW